MLTHCKQLKDQSRFDVAFTLNGAPLVNKFVDRLAEMEQLERALLPRAAHHRQRVFVLHGPGESGKLNFHSNLHDVTGASIALCSISTAGLKTVSSKALQPLQSEYLEGKVPK